MRLEFDAAFVRRAQSYNQAFRNVVALGLTSGVCWLLWAVWP